MKKRIKIKNKQYKCSPVAYIFTVILFLYVLSLVLPFIWGFMTSLKGNLDFSTNMFGLPHGHIWEWKWSNYAFVFDNFEVPVTNGAQRYTVEIFGLIVNSLLYAVGCSFIGALAPCVIGYLVTKFDYKLSRIIYAIALVAIIIPIVGNNVSMLQLLKTLNIYDTIISSWIMSANFLSLYFFVFCATFRGISSTFSEAAKIDGANNFTVFFKIMMPLVKGTFFTIVIIMFISKWNDYYTPLLYMPSKPTLAYGVYYFNTNSSTALDWPPMKIAGCMILVIPILIVFSIFHNRIMGNVSMGAIKE